MLIATPKIIDKYINQIPKGINVNIKIPKKRSTYQHIMLIQPVQ